MYAATSDEALQVAKHIVFEDVEVEWSASEWNTPFLDLHVYLDPSTRQLAHRPYRKPLNHRERIPWASHHPKDVKKGTFVGEMSRMAVLSSSLQHYSDALVDLRSLYQSRGYPPDLLRKWIKENYSKRWNNRLTKAEPSPSKVFVLKSHFNPAWSAFNIHELGKTVSDSWLSSLLEYDRAEQRRELLEREPVPGLDLAPQVIQLGPVLPVVQLPREAVRETVQRTLTDIWSGRTWREGEAGPSSDVSRVPEAQSTRGSPEALSTREQDSDDELVLDQAPRPVDPQRPLVETGKLRNLAFGGSKEVESVLNVRYDGLIDARWIVSRKRNRNLGDFVFSWRKSLLKLSSTEDTLMEHVDEWQ